MKLEKSSGKSQVKCPRWVIWYGIFNAISQTNILIPFIISFYNRSFEPINWNRINKAI